MISPEVATLLKASISADGKEAAIKAVAAWTTEKKSEILLELINSVDLTLILPKPKLIPLKEPTANEKEKDKKFILAVYLAGFIAWLVIWFSLGYIESITNLGLFGSRGNFVILLIFLAAPVGVGALALVSNLILLRGGSFSAEYENEVKAIDFVERHASFFLVGSSAVFFFASFSFRDLGLRFSFPAFVIYETLSLICLSTVLLLYWFPHERDTAKNERVAAQRLARMRHVKTIPFAFAVSFFLAALMIITTAALPVVVP